VTRHDLTGSPLDVSLAHLPLSQEARDVCSALDAKTIREFLARPTERLRNPSKRECIAEVRAAIDRYLTQTRLPTPSSTDQRRLLPLVKSRTAASALAKLGITTIEQFLSTSYDCVRGTKGLGPKVWQKITDTLLARSPDRAVAGDLLPDALRALDLRHVGLSAPTLATLEQLGCRTFAQVLGLPGTTWQRRGALGPAGAAELRTALDRMLATALQTPVAESCTPDLDWALLTGRLLAPLDADDRDVFCARIGLNAPIRTARELAHATGRSLETILAQEALVVSRLHERAPSLMHRLLAECQDVLDRQKGVLTGTKLQVGTALHVLATGSGNTDLPIRLLAFCFPEQFHDHDGCLSALPTSARLHFERELRALTAPRLLPRPLADIEAKLANLVHPVPRGLLLHLLADRFRLRIHHDAARGDLVLPQHAGPIARLSELLEEHGCPMLLVDLLFAYRERFHAASRQRLQQALRCDAMFVEIGPDIYSLRRWHADELALAHRRAEDVIAKVCELGGRRAVRDLIAPADARTQYLVLDQVQRDPRVRKLGRGEVCPAGQSTSHVLAQLLQAFRKAQGEVVLSLFLQNQPQIQRRLMERLLRENRLFVFPAADRIDVLANYPFNQQRLDRLLSLVENFLEAHGGHTTLSSVLAEVNHSELGGRWLDLTLLGEVLRRHGNLELLPGGIIASGELRLGGWLLRRARAALRAAAIPITVQEILAERPELAQFQDCLQELLSKDPLIQSPDGMHFMIA
jgi:hypothetical protein